MEYLNCLCMGLEMMKVFRQRMLISDLGKAIRMAGHELLADELEDSLAVFDAVQDEAEVGTEGRYKKPVPNEETGLYANDYYNDVLKDILREERERDMVKVCDTNKACEKTVYHSKKTTSIEDLVRKGEYYNACLRYQDMYGSTFAEACNAIAEKYLNKTGEQTGDEEE